jgi:hypothetical protein
MRLGAGGGGISEVDALRLLSVLEESVDDIVVIVGVAEVRCALAEQFGENFPLP